MFLHPDTPAMAELHLPPNVTEICSQAYWQIKKHNKRKRQENQQVFSSFWVKIRKEEDWHRMKAIRKHKRETKAGRDVGGWNNGPQTETLGSAYKGKEELWSKFREGRVSQYKGCDVGVEMI